MRIAWFTPYSPESAIGHCSQEITRALSQYASVDLWHPEAEEERTAEVPRIRFKHAEDVDLSILAQYDLIVYNMGNHLAFHGEIRKLAVRAPGVVILHDFVMHHFAAAYYLQHLKRPDQYIGAMKTFYGEPGAAVAQRAVSGAKPPVWETNNVLHFPMFEDAIQGAYGVIAHSHFLAEKVKRVFQGPVCKIPLACELPREGFGASREALEIPADRVLIVTAGHVNPYKRVHSVLRALATLGSLRDKILYVVLGPCSREYSIILEELVLELGLEDSVRFLGFAPEEIWHGYLQHADLCVNLRFPAFEGASRSMIEAMSYGKPVIVTDTGSYCELPDETVRKIAPDRETIELPQALRELITNAPDREELGRNARSLAASQFTVSHYVEKFLKFSLEVRRNKPALEFADRMSKGLGELGVKPSTEVATSIASRAYNLFFSPAIGD